MKILHLVGDVRYATQQQFERLAGALQGQGVTQHTLMANNEMLAGRLRDLGPSLREIVFPGRFGFFDRRTINGDIRRFAPDMLMSWTPSMGAFVERDGFLHLGRIDRNFDLSAVAASDHLLAASRVRADKATAAGWSAERVHVVPHLLGTEAAAAAKRAGQKPAERRTYFTPTTTKLAVTAVELVADSGVDVLIRAMARLSGIYLWVAGDGPARPALEELAHELGVKPRVRFLGWQDDLAPLLAVADMLIAPGPQDDTGDTVIEGWAAAVPVIGADSLGPGLLIQQQVNGVLVPVGDPVNLAEAIKWLSRDVAAARHLAEAGLRTFAETWRFDKVLPRYLALFDSLAAKPAPAPTP